MKRLAYPLPVLLYHGVGDGVGDTPVRQFEAHLAWLVRSGYRGLTLAEFESVVRGEGTFSEKCVLLTFDDGLASLATTAWPLLEKYRMPATAFLIASKVRSTDGSDYVSWSQLRRMRETGLLDCQSHSSTHARWERLTDKDQQLNVLRADLTLSSHLLAAGLGEDVKKFNHLAWPWGSCIPEWESLAIECGFNFQYLVQTAAVTNQGVSLRLPRVCCDGMDLSSLALRLSLLSNRTAVRPLNTLSKAWRQRKGRIGYLSGPVLPP